MANRRMATDGSEADLDEAGAKSQLRGMKMAFTDPKVCINYRPIFRLSNKFDADLHPCNHVSLHCRCDWLPELLSVAHSNAISK